MTDHAVPNLPSRDFDDTIAFYGGFGFELSYRDDGWLILHRGELQLEFFLFPEHVPARSSFLCSIRVDDVDALYRQIAQAGVIERSTGFPRRIRCGRSPGVSGRDSSSIARERSCT